MSAEDYGFSSEDDARHLRDELRADHAQIATLRAENARIRELEAAPTSEEVRSLVRVLSERGKKIEWDGGGVSADQQLLHAADVIERLDRERQELKRDLALREKPFQAGRRSVIDKANESNRIIGEEYARQIERAEAAEAALAEARKDQEQLREHIADIHNRVRHELYAEIEAAQDKAFKAMSGSAVLRAAIAREGETR